MPQGDDHGRNHGAKLVREQVYSETAKTTRYDSSTSAFALRSDLSCSSAFIASASFVSTIKETVPYVYKGGWVTNVTSVLQNVRGEEGRRTACIHSSHSQGMTLVCSLGNLVRQSTTPVCSPSY